jgi:hypothetical protein
MDADKARELYEDLLAHLEMEYVKAFTMSKGMVQPGSFGNDMEIESVADGPCTLVIDSVKDPRAVAKRERQLKEDEKDKKEKVRKKAELDT